MLIYSAKFLSRDHVQAGLKGTESIESMRTADTDHDGVSRLLTVDQATEATTVSKILSNDHAEAKLSEQLKETKSAKS